MALDRAISAYRAHPGPHTLAVLHRAAEPKRQELIRRLNQADGGTARIVGMRGDLLRFLPLDPDLEAVDVDFVHLLSSWFNRGFLELRRIDWSTPAQILERIIRYEAVHTITSWDDLRGRIEPPDRRCFAFFHPRLPDEPLIFVEVALTDGIPGAIAPLLARERRPLAPSRANTAVFYSTSNCQAGLKGISFGHFLIKQVVDELKRETPALSTFVTLSPVPGFVAWLKAERAAASSAFLTAADRSALHAMDRPGWASRPSDVRALRPVLVAALVHCLLRARNAQGRPVDPVARFHLGAGARLERVNWMGDPSGKGLAHEAGFMVNYAYDPHRIERNHELFVNEGEVVASGEVRRLLRTRDRGRGPRTA